MILVIVAVGSQFLIQWRDMYVEWEHHIEESE